MKACAAILTVLAGIAQADTLRLPANATLEAEEISTASRYRLPSGPWAGDALPTEVIEGDLRQEAWRIPAAGVRPLDILRPLRAQLSEMGYRTLLDCETQVCGGFDFRFATQVLPPPQMQVNLGEFLFLSAQKDTPDGPRAISLMISRTADAGYVQVTYAGALPETAERITTSTAPAIPGRATAPLAQALETQGRAVLDGLSFATGSAQLTTDNAPALAALADYLALNPARRVALVGHTDAEGSLEGNIALSKRRAGTVLERLVADYGVNRAQLAAEGMGYLSPLRSNLTSEGRKANRRVEVILTSTSP